MFENFVRLNTWVKCSVSVRTERIFSAVVALDPFYLDAKMKKYERLSLLTPAKKRKILERDDYCCAYCFGPADQVDHIIPLSYIRDESDENLVACCWLCNLLASDFVFHTLSQKREFIRKKRYNYIDNHVIPLWTRDEVDGMGRKMQLLIQKECVVCDSDDHRKHVSYKLMQEGWKIVTHGYIRVERKVSEKNKTTWNR